MGITISGKYKGRRSPYELNMSYSTFFRLRCTIARCLDDRLYSHYLHLIDYRGSEAEWDEYDRITNEIIQQSKIDSVKWKCKIVDFLFMPDTNGKISYGTCKRLYSLIKNEPDEDQYGYTMIGDNTMGTFKMLLKDVYVNGGTLIWR